MEKAVSGKACSLLIAVTLSVSACTHLPTQPNTLNNKILSNIATNAIMPDFIAPPITASQLENSSITFGGSKQLIWHRITKGLALTEFYSHPAVIQQRQKYLAKTDYLSVVTRQSEPFIHFILSEIEQRKMPAELAILPIVESSYFPRARSSSKAVGLWQFLSHTAKEFGLQQRYGYDGRHDVHASTGAALDYLTHLYGRFDGDWLLALAAYNAGPKRIKQALRSNSANNSVEDYWNLKLPRETREYIPKILALCSIVSDSKLSESLLHPVGDKPYIETIEVNKRVLPEKIVQASGVNATELYKLNPALRNTNYPILEGYHLLVPKHDAQLLSMTINNLPEDILPVWGQHEITTGESLSVIARRYGTSVVVLQQANNLHGDIIVAGRTLLIPQSESSR